MRTLHFHDLVLFSLFVVFFVVTRESGSNLNGRHETDGMEDRQWNIEPTKWKLGRLRRPENIIAKG